MYFLAICISFLMKSLKLSDFTFFLNVSVIQSWLTLCDPMDCSTPGSSVHGLFQARILERVTIPFSRRFSNPGIEPRSLALQADSLPSDLPSVPPGKPKCLVQIL